jgi:hypothetical protein
MQVISSIRDTARLDFGIWVGLKHTGFLPAKEIHLHHVFNKIP